MIFGMKIIKTLWYNIITIYYIGSMNIFPNNIMSISHIKRDIISNYLDSENSINNLIKTERCPR